jgi:hypothetical protein
MSIIDVEIAKRQAIIQSKEDKLAQAIKMREDADVLEKEALEIDAEVLMSEIEELETYLPKPEEETEDNVEA